MPTSTLTLTKEERENLIYSTYLELGSVSLTSSTLELKPGVIRRAIRGVKARKQAKVAAVNPPVVFQPKERKKKIRRNDGPFPWGLHYESWCPNCRRTIENGDLVHMFSWYDSVGLVKAYAHFDCREVSHRPRSPQPETNEHQNAEGTRRLSYMSAKTKKKNKKAKGAAAAEETNDAAEETNTQAPAKAKKSAKSKKSAKASSKAAAADADEDEDSDDEEEETETSSKSKSKSKSKGDGSGDSFAVTTGKRLVELLAEGPKKLRVIATSLSKGKDVTHAELVTLKEGIKEYAAKDRADGEGKLSSQLSAMNSRVRRLERDAR